MTKSSLVITDELLMAFADGELENGLARQVEIAIAGNPALASRLEVFRLTGRALGPHFDAVLEAQPPAAMLQAIRSAPMTRLAQAPGKVSFGDSLRNVLQGFGFGPSPWPTLATLAAGIVIGVVAMQTGGPGGTALVAEQNGKLIAAGQLAQTLESKTMRESLDGGIRVMATFKDETGRWCRLYQGSEHSGLACRQQTPQWQILAAGEGVAGSADTYGTAAGGGAKAVDDLIETMMGPEGALDAEADASLVKGGWPTE